MPTQRSAYKELRKTKKRTVANAHVQALLKRDLKAARRAVAAKAAEAGALVNTARKTLAKAAQRGVIHANKAARLTSRLESK
ncbi:30S ribosomal protein S20 [Candidatus Uhrbacteria bacterium]|nr:30S ribosomal protein S20 [Candidatus Uhrbacteria bacterium]